jgi:2-C-methyl-D-erythritol 4-phosphate cytidylyltransferase
MNVVVIVTVAHHAADGELALTPVHGEALLTHTVRGLLDVPEIDLVLVAAPQRCAKLFSEALSVLSRSGLSCRVVPGSLRQAFAVVEPELPRDSVVLLHDALRAFVPAQTVRDVVNAVGDDTPVVVPVLPMADTVKVTDAAELIVGTEDRGRLRTAQTPIGFTLPAFRAAESHDLAAVVRAGAATVPGHPDAMRVTTGFELSLAEAIAAAPKNEETL